MERKFNVVMKVPLGKRYGVLTLTEIDGRVAGALNILGNEDSFVGTISDEGMLEFSGLIKSLLHVMEYQAQGKIIGSKIELILFGEGIKFLITGEEIK